MCFNVKSFYKENGAVAGCVHIWLFQARDKEKRPVGGITSLKNDGISMGGKHYDILVHYLSD